MHISLTKLLFLFSGVVLHDVALDTESPLTTNQYVFDNLSSVDFVCKPRTAWLYAIDLTLRLSHEHA